MKNDITNHQDIQFLVHTFYDLVVKDDLIGYFFSEVAQVNWDQHLPHMVQFWDTVLLGAGTFEGWPMRTHLMLNKKRAHETRTF
jgi:Truncated hemoglobins